MLEAQEERTFFDSDSSFQLETRSKVKRWAPVRPFKRVPDYTDSESMAESDAMESQTSYRFMKWKPKTPAQERVSIETRSKISQWPPSPTYQESDSESIAGSEASSISFESKTKVKIWKPAVQPKPKSKYKFERSTFESKETSSISIDTSSTVNTIQQQPRPFVRPEVEETSITKKSEMKVSLGRKAPKVSSGFRMDIPKTDEPEQVDLGRSRFRTQLTRRAEQRTFGAPEDSDMQVEVSEPELDEMRAREEERMTIFSRKSEQKISFQSKGAKFLKETAKVKLGIPDSKLDEKHISKPAQSQEPRMQFARKTEQNIQLQSRAAKKPLPMKLDISEPVIDERRTRARSQETRTEYSRKSETNIVIIESDAGEESDTYYHKRNIIRKLPTPTPDKLVIEGELFPQKPVKQKRERVRKQGQPKSSTYKPVPYVPGPTTIVVPERKDVLTVAETWDRYKHLLPWR